MFLRNLKVSYRFALGFGLIALLVLVLGVVATARMADMRKESLEVDQNWLPSITALGELSTATMRLRALTMRALVQQDPQQLAGTLQTLTQLDEQVDAKNAAYRERVTIDSERQAYQRFDQALAGYLPIQREIVRLVTAGQRDEAIELQNGPINGHADQMTAALRELLEINRNEAAAAAARSGAVYESAITLVIGAILVTALLTIVLAWSFTRSIVQPLNEAVTLAEAVAGGDLTQTIEVTGKDEPARLLAALRTMQGSLRDTIQNISHSSNQLASAAEELNAVTEDSTRGLHQQNHEIEQAAAAVNEMTTAVDEVARNAVATSESSRDSDRIAQQGRQQVIKTVSSIDLLANDVTATSGEVGQLADKVRDISQVLDVIRSIAEQTNLLALNAAIEAARAGEAGRGFAVVADEVRALAHRTQQSTHEIEQMIGGVQQGAEKAVSAMQSSNERARSTLDVAKAAGDALDEIARAISEISERNLVIASASEEQAQVAREVDKNLVNIRDLSLQSSAGANQTSAASQELARLAVDLNGLVARFRL
ncbi:methyl-accepting chemotaxis protein [Stutzerimonas urumqiensis]|uniref:methyl-accepting chemotaxis protein n=1 Tax=Stutzerimonas urumqiensis TaxID=638269 RepID=UPI000EAE8929|nr:methyl-accepting chemotaxis protein [Stutzerimonas urumqiensis]